MGKLELIISIMAEAYRVSSNMGPQMLQTERISGLYLDVTGDYYFNVVTIDNWTFFSTGPTLQIGCMCP